MSDLRRRNGRTIAERSGDRTPDRTQRLLNRQSGVKRQYLGREGKVANGINTVHLAYVREGTGHALTGAREWIPAAQIGDPARFLGMGLPEDLVFRTKGQLATDILTEAFADGIRLDFVCGDEAYGSCTRLPEFREAHGQAYVARVPSSFQLMLPGGVTLTCKQAAGRPARLGDPLRRDGIKRTPLVRLGVAGHRLRAAPPADPPPPDHRRSRLLLLLPARRPAGIPVPADPRRRAALASRRRFRVRQGLLRARPVSGPGCMPRPPGTPCWSWPPWPSVPSPPLCSAAIPTPSHPPPRTRTSPRRPRHDPAHRPRNRTPARPSAPTRQRRAPAGLAPAARPAHAGTTSAHASPAMPQLSRSASEWRLPF